MHNKINQIALRGDCTLNIFIEMSKVICRMDILVPGVFQEVKVRHQALEMCKK